MSVFRRLLTAGSLALGLALAMPAPASAGQHGSPAFQEAAELYKAKDLKGAAKAFNTVVKDEPENFKAWNMLGMSYLELGKYKKAIKAWETAAEVGAPAWLTNYNIGCAKALSGDVDGAFESLEASYNAGLNNAKLIKEDKDLKSLHGDPRFEELVLRVDQKGRPCEFDDAYSGLDFWLGDWAVTGPKGQFLAKNSIEKDLKSCLVIEHWQSKLYGSGKSFNYYDPSTESWHQTWIGDNGSLARMEGQVDGDSITFEGDSIQPNGKVMVTRMVLTRDGNGVLQTVENGEDMDSLKVVFKGTYGSFEESEYAKKWTK